MRRHALNSARTPSSFHIEPRRFIVKRRRNAKSRRPTYKSLPHNQFQGTGRNARVVLRLPL